MSLAPLILLLTPILNAITQGMYVLYPLHLLTFHFPALCSWPPISPCHIQLQSSGWRSQSHISAWTKSHTSCYLMWVQQNVALWDKDQNNVLNRNHFENSSGVGCENKSCQIFIKWHLLLIRARTTEQVEALAEMRWSLNMISDVVLCCVPYICTDWRTH